MTNYITSHRLLYMCVHRYLLFVIIKDLKKSEFDAGKILGCSCIAILNLHKNR